MAVLAGVSLLATAGLAARMVAADLGAAVSGPRSSRIGCQRLDATVELR